MLIRTYKDGDEKQIWELDRRLETHPWNRRELSNWYWKYTESNPAGKSSVWLMEEAGRIIAHFAAVPYRVKVFDKEIVASHSIAAMVEERYQNKGILKFVGDKLFDELAQRGIPFTYGFPNKRSYMLHKMFMGYADLLSFDTWKIEKDAFADNLSFDLLRPVNRFSKEFTNLWEEFKVDYKIAVIRDESYLNWRYRERPDWEYFPFALYDGGLLKGYVVLKLYREADIMRGHILDIFANIDDRDTFCKLIEGSLGFFKERLVKEATCWLHGNRLIEEALLEKGFYRQNNAVPLLIRSNKEFTYTNDIFDNKNWYFTMGDSTEIF